MKVSLHKQQSSRLIFQQSAKLWKLLEIRMSHFYMQEHVVDTCLSNALHANLYKSLFSNEKAPSQRLVYCCLNWKRCWTRLRRRVQPDKCTYVNDAVLRRLNARVFFSFVVFNKLEKYIYMLWSLTITVPFIFEFNFFLFY